MQDQLSVLELRTGQKHAEGLLNGAIALFDHLGSTTRTAEAHIELACCYYRQGLFDLSRTTLRSVLDRLSVNDYELKSLSLIRLAVVERHAGRLRDSLSLLEEAFEVAERTGPWVTARYYQELGSTLKDLALSESTSDYFYRALKHYGEALNQFEAIGNHRYAAVVHNNYGFMLLSFGDLAGARYHLRIAREFFNRFSDLVKRAQVDESLARLQLAAGQFKLAEETIAQAVAVLESGDEDALLAEALTTKGLILSRHGRKGEASAALESAYRVSERCGDNEGAGRALLVVIEEMGSELSRSEQLELGARAIALLGKSQQKSAHERLRNCLELLNFDEP